MYALTPEAIAEHDALLAALEASTGAAEYYPRYALVEQAWNSCDLMGQWAERDRLRAEARRMRPALEAMLRAEYDAPLVTTKATCDSDGNWTRVPATLTRTDAGLQERLSNVHPIIAGALAPFLEAAE